ncbi:hypothetical protein [Streptomyces sp. HNM0645]|uniref:hypothetical protein n=1 Tax=unclassified Streptomyces TaxID=2593676 RepID=UPI0024B73932|nr:hypothetical protein [Streptomyces sp. HNM0645]MDI9887317.1 hypothetical protein [Streptomyces sp. HNM0645]
MSARDRMTIRNDAEWNATVDEILAEHRAEVLREAADKLALEMTPESSGAGPGFLLAIRLCVRALRRMSDSAAVS